MKFVFMNRKLLITY